MEKVKHVLFHSWYVLETLEDRIYHIILDVAVFISVISVVAGLIQSLPPVSMVMTVLILIYLIIIQYITIRHPKYSKYCRVALLLGFNLVLFPICFFASGGVYSGMILFYLIGLSMCAMLVRGNTGGILFVLSLLVLEFSITISGLFPQWVEPMTPKQHLSDMKITLLLTAMALYSIFVLILRAYDKERRQNEALVEKLRNMSVKDALSGLYNRRELFRRLELMYSGAPKERTETLSRAGHYIAMFDVDDFKSINDTYGHSVGDRVLSTISHVLYDMVNPRNGELSARYGGEEFVSILAAQSMNEAYERVNRARERVSELHWEDIPGLTVSISGGILSCEDYTDLNQTMHDVDELLYKAKADGKNRICCE